MLWVELWLRAVRHPELRPVAEELYARLHAWFADEIAAGVADGEFDRCDPDEVADRTLALIDGFGIRTLIGDGAIPLERARPRSSRRSRATSGSASGWCRAASRPGCRDGASGARASAGRARPGGRGRRAPVLTAPSM